MIKNVLTELCSSSLFRGCSCSVGAGSYQNLLINGFITRKIKSKIETIIDEWDIEAKIIIHMFSNFATFKQEKSSELLNEIRSDIKVLKKFGVTGIADRLTMFMKRYY